MAQGDLRGTISTALTSLNATSAANGSIAVVRDDLIFVVFGQATSLSAVTLSDNLGTGTYTATNAGTDAGNIVGRAFYKRVLAAANLTTVGFSASVSTNDWAGIVAVFEGPFGPGTRMLDANPTNTTVGTSNPILMPAVTANQDHEVVIGWATANHSTAWNAVAPLTVATQVFFSSTKAILGYQTVTATNIYQVGFSSSIAPPQVVKGANSFRLLTLGTAALTLDALALSASGTVPGGPITGTAALTLDALTLTANANAQAQGTLNSALDALTLAATGTVQAAAATGTATLTLDALTLAATAGARIQGTFANTLGALTLAAMGTVQSGAATGTAALTLADLTLAATGGTRIQGTFANTLDALTLSASGTVQTGARTGTAALTLDALTLAAAGGARVQGTFSNTLDALTLAATGTTAQGAVTGTAALTLDALALSAQGYTRIQGTLGVTLGALTLAASNTTAKHHYIFDVGGPDVRNIFESEYDVSYLIAPVEHATDFV